MLKKVLSLERTGNIIYDEIHIINNTAFKFNSWTHGTDKVVRKNIR